MPDRPETILTGDFERPFIDIDEWRDEPVRHRYVHGGFEGTAARFSLYFPPEATYGGRFFQHITPVPDSENLARSGTGQEDKIGFAFHAGGYFLETNGGGVVGTPGSSTDPTVGAYRANAASAEYSRVVARSVYSDHRPYGYVYGGSGGAYRTLGGAENTVGIWDGFVPYVPGSPMAIPNVFSVRMHAQRILRDDFDRIVDALEPGGSGDPYEGLDEEKRAALAEVTRMGFPPASWFGHATMGNHAFDVLSPHLALVDPQYFDEFWTARGYLGADLDASIHRDRIRLETDVVGVVTRGDGVDLGPYADTMAGAPRSGVDQSFKGGTGDEDAVVALRLGVVPDGAGRGAELAVISGPAEGTRCTVRGIRDDMVVLDTSGPNTELAKARPGDTVIIDNSNFLAAQTYHRHQVPDPEYAVWDQFRDEAGDPRCPQRPMLVGPLFTAAASGHLPTGQFDGKMIMVACLLDREAFAWQADWYRNKVDEYLGDRAGGHFRLWYVDNALHGDDERQEHPTHTVSYLGVLHEALQQLADWVERDIPPAPNTEYTVVDGQVRVPERAADRHGVQPVVRVGVDGGARADIDAGAEVSIEVEAATPEKHATLVRAQWDLDGDGVFELDELLEPADAVVLRRRHTYTTPGTRFVTVRISAQRDADGSTSFARIDNLARARVVVR
ncbi:hypothetical protein [Nocardia noduli]|uniref:hypothetical protein n=1 Tax=Nocardia noduli TaxID=2815722 RepID=UPI0020B2D758|nr:hypothetical protein [Nocardia noduli]